MRHCILGILVAVISCGLLTVQSNGFVDLPPGFTAVAITPKLTKPVSIAFAPDGRLFVAEKRGMIRVYKNKKKLGTFIDLRPEINNSQELGLMAIELDHQFPAKPYVYMLYTADFIPGTPDDPAESGNFSRLTRYKVSSANKNKANLASRKVLIGKLPSQGFPACYSSHTVGDLQAAPDNTLLVTSGDGATYVGADAGGMTPDCFKPGLFGDAEDIGSFRSQRMASPNGKLLRIKRDGKAPPSNPYFDGNPNSFQSKIWSYGLRNPFRMALKPNPPSGNFPPVFVGDVGWNSYEEINVAKGGENFGWPCKEGPLAAPTYPGLDPANSGCDTLNSPANPGPVKFPVVYYHLNNPNLSKPVGLGGRSITLGKFYNANKYPSVYKNGLFFADFVQGWIKVLKVDSNNNFLSVTDFASNAGGPVDFAIHPTSGDLCFISWTDQKVYQIKYTGTDLMAQDALPAAIGCVADVSPAGGDGVIDANDLLAVLDALGQTTDVVDGDADIAPAALNGDGQVDADDLLAVLNAWGPCE
jgi:glucose/arabinose dehydrogenase